MGAHDVDIFFDNAKENDEFYQSLALVKGRVRCRTLPASLSLDGTIHVTNCGTNQVSFTFAVVQGCFKCLLPLLGTGSLSLRFSFHQDNHSGEALLKLHKRSISSSKLVQLVYVVPKESSGTFQTAPGDEDASKESACQKIVLGAQLLQCLTAERLYEEGFGRMTFQLASDEDDRPVCLVYNSRRSRDDFHSLSSQEIWNATARELLQDRIITESVKVLAFLSCTQCTGPAEDFSQALANTKGYVACGKGNLAMLGSSGLHSWASRLDQVFECLTSSEPVHPTLLNDTGFRGTMGACYATTLGSALHELGHVFDLVHADTGVMARGFEDLDLYFTHMKRKQLDKTGTRPGDVEAGLSVRIQVRPKETRQVVSFSTRHQRRANNVEDGRAFFHRSATVLLSAHPWFTQCDPDQAGRSGEPPTVDGLEIRAANAIRLIELHSEDDDLIKYWDFARNPTRLSRFRIGVHDVAKVPGVRVLVQDFAGNLVKRRLDVPSL